MGSLRKDQTRAIQLMVIGCLLFLPLMDTAAKFMGETIASAVIVLGRFAFQSVFLLPFVWKTIYMPKGTELRLHLLRSLSIAVATVCFFTAIQVMPIADALAIFFVMPLLVTLLAPWVLGETVGWRRLAAVAVGMMGAVIIIQPGHEVFGLRALLPLGTAFCFSFYLMFTRKLAREIEGSSVPPITMQFFSGSFGTLIMAVTILIMQPFDFAVFNWTFPELWQWRQLAIVGFLAAIGHLFVTMAFKHADASILAPFQYIELVGAAFLGWYFFDDIPSASTWLGSAILVGSGLYIFHRERAAEGE